MTTTAKIQSAFEALENVVRASVTDGAGYVHIVLDRIGSGDADRIARKIRITAAREIAAGVAWTVDIRSWRWRWLRRLHWPAKIRSVHS